MHPRFQNVDSRAKPAKLSFRHCEKRSDEAIQPVLAAPLNWIASLRSQ
jgi:hypothetical protein